MASSVWRLKAWLEVCLWEGALHLNKELVEWHADNISRKVGDGHASARCFLDVPEEFL